MAIVGLLSLAGAIVLFLAPRLRVFAQVDRAARNVRIRNRVVPFGEIRRFAVPPSSERMRSLCVETTGRELIRIWTATPPQFDALEALASQLNEVTGKVGAAALPEPGAATTAAAMDQRFRTQVILCIGLLWTVGGFFLFRGVSFAARLEADGLQIPVWSAGLLILAFGVVDWLRSRRR